ncbi:MAG: flagellar protein FlaG [Mariprofundales bacterium]
MADITQISSAPVATAAPPSGQASAAPRVTRAPQPAASASNKTVGSSPQPSEGKVAQAVEASNNALINSNNEAISFGYEKRLGLLFVQVTDKSTGEVLREIPSKDFIRNAIAMRESIGLMLNQKG